MEWIIGDTKDLDSYGEKILEMYSNTYKNIGLIDFGGWNGLKDYLNCSCYLLINERKQLNGAAASSGEAHNRVTLNNAGAAESSGEAHNHVTQELNGVILYWLSEYGNKISLVISLNSEIAKSHVIPKLYELLKTPGFYVELSDALEYLIRQNGLENIKNKDVIKKLIPHLNDEDIFDENDTRCTQYLLNAKKRIPSPSGSFLREIKDIGQHRKAIYGLPCMSQTFDKAGCNRKCLITGGKGKKIKTRKNKSRNKKSKNKKLNNK